MEDKSRGYLCSFLPVDVFRLLHQLCDEGTEEKMELTKLKGGREWLISCA